MKTFFSLLSIDTNTQHHHQGVKIGEEIKVLEQQQAMTTLASNRKKVQSHNKYE